MNASTDTQTVYITRDGELVATLDDGTDPLAWFHRNVSYSMDHAITHEGYAVTTTKPKPSTYGTEIASTFIGETRDDDGWGHYEWRVTLTRDGKTRVLPYKMGLGHIQTKCGKPIATDHRGIRRMPCTHVGCHNVGPKPTPPDLYSVFCSLKADSTNGETFEDWCVDFGYDTDSRKAMDTYLACQNSENESRKFFGSDWARLVEDEQYT